MTALQIILLVIGLVFLVGSFFVSEKLSSSDLEEMKKMSQQAIKVILDKELQSADSTIEEKIQGKLDDVIEDLERKSDKETNDKIMAISEYSDTVLNSMNKSHEEIIFMYDMLNDKQERITEIVKEMQAMESAITQMEEALDEKIEQVGEEVQRQIELTKVKEEMPTEPEISMEEALQTQLSAQEEDKTLGDNQEILSLFNEGMTEVDIAKKLGRGLGEIKLVLGLFSEGTKE